MSIRCECGRIIQVSSFSRIARCAECKREYILLDNNIGEHAIKKLVTTIAKVIEGKRGDK